MANGGQSTKVGRTGAPPRAANQQAKAPAQTANVDARGFSDYDAADYHDLYAGRAYYQRQGITPQEQKELDKYTDPNTLRGSLYNYSQEMNQANINGTMTTEQQKTFNTLVGAMHNLGYNVNLTRYDHGDALDYMLREAGIATGHQGMTISQLKSALVGKAYTDKRILSTSYNNFKNAADPSTFTTREVKFTYRAKASTQAMMPGVGKVPMRGSGMARGDDFGEMLLAPTNGSVNNYRVVDIKYSGAKARLKGGSKYNLNVRQIEIVVEVG